MIGTLSSGWNGHREHSEGKTVKIGNQISEADGEKLEELLRENTDIFAWDITDIPGIDPTVAQHTIPTSSVRRPSQQVREQMGRERSKFIREETQRLHRAGLIAEVKHPRWISNPVITPDQEGEWRMTVDFRLLNEATHKEKPPLGNARPLGRRYESVLSANTGYYQIPLNQEDRDKTSFHAGGRTWCYTRMPPGLKNARTTYQRLVNLLFEPLMGIVMEMDGDNMIVKSSQMEEHVIYLARVFAILRKNKLKLDPSKCIFGVQSESRWRKLQGSLRKIICEYFSRMELWIIATSKAAAAKIRAYLRTQKEDGEESALTGEQDQVFYFDNEPLYVYLGTSTDMVGAVLVKEGQGRQWPTNSIGRSLIRAELEYSVAERAAYAITIAAKQWKQHFRSGLVTVLTDQPVMEVLQQPGAPRHIKKWATELEEFEFYLQPLPAKVARAVECAVTEVTTGITTRAPDEGRAI